ncbi:MAG: WecB/TagA/CpsF family glycosyltransferase [Candidatus Humimicrobiaceae bacterium]
MDYEKIEILGLKISKDGLDPLMDQAAELIKKNARFFVCTVNAFMTVKANEDKELLKIINKAKIVLPDGMSTVWVSKRFKKFNLRRISGFDFFHEFSKISDKKGFSYFFMGGKREDILIRIKNKLQNEFSNIIFKGYFCPSFYSKKMPENENEKIIDIINDCKPDILWIGISSPKQEKWIYSNLSRLNIKMACCVGAVFDFYSGEINRAPIWMQEHYLEWLYRIYSEPKRLFKKYLIYNTKFMMLVLKNKIKGNLKI